MHDRSTTPTRAAVLWAAILGGLAIGGLHGLVGAPDGLVLGWVGVAGLLVVDGLAGALMGALASLPLLAVGSLRGRGGIGLAVAWGALAAAGAVVGPWVDGWTAQRAVWLAVAVLPCLAGWALLWLKRPALRQAASYGVVGVIVVVLGSGRHAVPTGRAASAEAPLVLLVTIDGARADRYGGYVIDTPALDRLAAEGVSAELAVAGPFGRPLRDVLGVVADQAVSDPGLPGRVRSRGQPTVAVLSRRAPPVSVGAADLAFDVFDGDTTWPAALDRTIPGRWLDLDAPARRRSDRVVDRAIAALERMPGQGLLWVDLADPLPPWDPPEPFDARYQPGDPAAGPPLKERATLDPAHQGSLDALTDPRSAIALYDGEIAWTDRQLGRLLQWLDDHGRQASTLVVVVGTGGMRLDDGPVWFSSHGALTDGLLHVPLAMRLPGVLPRGERLTMPVTLADVGATLADLLGVDGLAIGDGVSLRQAWAGTGQPRNHVVVHTDDGVAWREPGLLVAWSRDVGFTAQRFPLESDRPFDRARVARILGQLDVPRPATATEIDALLRQLRGEAADPTGLAPSPSAD